MLVYLSCNAFRVKLCECFLADVIRNALHKKVGDVNVTTKGIDQIHARREVWRFPVVEFFGFILQVADESYSFHFALEYVEGFGHAYKPLMISKQIFASRLNAFLEEPEKSKPNAPILF